MYIFSLNIYDGHYKVIMSTEIFSFMLLGFYSQLGLGLTSLASSIVAKANDDIYYIICLQLLDFGMHNLYENSKAILRVI